MRWILSIRPTTASLPGHHLEDPAGSTHWHRPAPGTPLADAVMNGNVLSSRYWLLGYKVRRHRAPAFSDELDGLQRQQPAWHQRTPGPAGASGTWSAPTWTPRPSIRTATAAATEPRPRETTHRNWLASCSDGFNCTSQAAAGRCGSDTSRMAGGEPLSHNQSRRACFGLDVILRNDLRGRPDHAPETASPCHPCRVFASGRPRARDRPAPGSAARAIRPWLPCAPGRPRPPPISTARRWPWPGNSTRRARRRPRPSCASRGVLE